MVHHDAVPDAGLPWFHGVADELDDPARFVPFDDQLGLAARVAVKMM
nr:hypothetical protein [Rhodococcus sp. Leaf258]